MGHVLGMQARQFAVCIYNIFFSSCFPAALSRLAIHRSEFPLCGACMYPLLLTPPRFAPRAGDKLSFSSFLSNRFLRFLVFDVGEIPDYSLIHFPSLVTRRVN